MAGIAYDDPLFAAQAGAATDWGSVEGGVLVRIPVQAELNRGLAVELGIEAMANLDAGFSKFLTAELGAHAQVQAGVRGQIQMPMNLFREVGFAVRLQAILEAAAGVRVGLGISIGDFVALAQSQLQLRGLPLNLFRIFLEEVEIGASLHAKVAFTAQAYANLVATGTLVGDGQTQPGFNIVFGYGYGFKGGYGMRMVARAGLRDVSRFVARSVDTIVDHTIDELIAQMPAADATTPRLLDATRAPAKIAFRIGYELGDYIVRNSIPMTGAGAQNVALRCTQVVLEESQRYLLRKLIDVCLDAVTGYLRNEFDQVDESKWNAMRGAREQLAALLEAMPAEPFDLRDGSTRAYWNDVSIQLTNLAISLVGANSIPAGVRRDLATVWSAVQLMFAATERVVRSSASVSVIGLAPATAKASFAGPLPSQPHAVIAQVVRDAVPAATTPPPPLTQQDLLEFLTGTVVLDALRARAPEIDRYIEAFVGRIAPSPNDVARLLMTSLGSIMKDANGNFDDVATLREFAFGLRLFLADKFEAEVVPAIRAAVPSTRPEPLMAVDEVLVPSMHMVMDTCFDQVVGWASGAVSQKALEEALSSVIMSVIGRTLVLTGDVLMAATQEQTVDILRALARPPGAPAPTNALVSVPAGFPESAAQIIAPGMSMSATDVAEWLREFLGIAADVARPFPQHVRRKVRGLMYEVIAPLPPENPSSLAQSLKNDLWIPNDQALMALGEELIGQVGDRFVAFALRLLERLGEIVIEQLTDAIAALVAAVVQWFEDLASAIQLLVQRLAEIALELIALLASIEQLVDRTLEEIQGLLSAMSGRRSELRQRVVNRLSGDALVFLKANPVYMIMPPGVKQSARNAMRAAISAALENPVLGPVFDAISAIAADVNSLLDDVRALDPNAGLVTGIQALLLERIRQRVLAAFGGSNPGINVGFTVAWSRPVVVYYPPTAAYPYGRVVTTMKQETTTFDLGRVELPVSAFFDLIGEAILKVSVVEQRITALAQAIVDLLHAELLELAMKTERDAVAATRDRLEQERSLGEVEIGGVEIHEPAMASVHGYSVPITIVVEGAPPAALEVRPDAPQRALICLDGEPMDLSRFSITPWSAGAVLRHNDLGLLRNPQLRGRPSTLSDWPQKSEHAGTTAVRDAVGRQGALRADIATASVRAVRMDHAVRDATRGASTSSCRGKGSSRAILTALEDSGGSTTRALRSGCVLSTIVPLASLDEGPHTLTVSIVDGAGREFRAFSTFIVDPVRLRLIGERAFEPTRPVAVQPDRESVTPGRSPSRGADAKPLFPSRAERAARARRVREAVMARRVDPIRTAAMVSPGTREVAVRRHPTRRFDAVDAIGIGMKPMPGDAPDAPLKYRCSEAPITKGEPIPTAPSKSSVSKPSKPGKSDPPSKKVKAPKSTRGKERGR